MYNLSPQFLTSVVIFAFCFLLFPGCCESLIRYPFLFLLRLEASYRFSGYFQQDCLDTFPEIFWVYLIVCSLQCRKCVGHLCCKLYCFVFLEFSRFRGGMLCFSQPNFQRRHVQLMICVAVCSGIPYLQQFDGHTSDKKFRSSEL